VVFEADYDEIELQNIVMRHQNHVTKIFPIWAPPNQNFLD